MTRREQLIGQLRAALGMLEKPIWEGDDTDVVFDVAETEFDFTGDELDIEICSPKDTQ
jgi:hypothetical protein